MRSWADARVSLGPLAAVLLSGSCSNTSERNGDPDDAKVAFGNARQAGVFLRGERSSEIGAEERFCLRSAQLFCDTLEPCCHAVGSTSSPLPRARLDSVFELRAAARSGSATDRLPRGTRL